MNTESFGRIATATATTALSIATVAGVGHVVDHRVRVQQVEVLAQLGATASSLREPRSGGGVLGTSALSALRTEMSASSGGPGHARCCTRTVRRRRRHVDAARGLRRRRGGARGRLLVPETRGVCVLEDPRGAARAC